MTADVVAAAKQAALAAPHDAEAQLAAAVEHDRAGLERDAVRYYERVLELGVPGHAKRRFYVGYGSTLRNVGRADDAVAILGQALVDEPNYPPYSAFLSLALLSAGHPRAAVAAMLGCALDVAVPGVFDGFERALGAYHGELLETRS
jgi:tetratricopeptide (TPR) repeat protein